ncbi:MAG: hypothetical protein Fur0041_04210 [Bacteroidia bacterium]
MAKKIVSKKPAKKAVKPAKKVSKPVVKKAKEKAKPAKAVKKATPAKAHSVKSAAKKSVEKNHKKAVKPVAKKTAKSVKKEDSAKKDKELLKSKLAVEKNKKTDPAPKSKKQKAEKAKGKSKPSDDDEEIVIEDIDLLLDADDDEKEEIVVKEKPRPLTKEEIAKLPKLPSGITVKKQKGKLQPGEKRIVKTEVITHHLITDKPIENTSNKAKPEPKGKFTLEYIIRSPVALIYDFLTTPNGLAEWFADEVDVRNDVYKFGWDGSVQYAQILNAKLDSYIRLKWQDKPEGTYFEFRLNQDELTGEVSLTITDFGESEDDIETNKHLWNSQIQRLIKAMGAY